MTAVDVALISKDRELFDLCNQVLGEFPMPVSVLQWHDAPKCESRSTFYIWDYEPGLTVTAELRKGYRRQLFLVHRHHFPEFREAVPSTEANVLFKPVALPVLRAFLSQICAWTVEVGSIQADRDDLLHYLIQANRKLQEYDQERTTFLARAVHDFRAPLTAITGYCGLLAQQLEPGDTTTRAVLERIQHSAKRLVRLTEGMLQISFGRRADVRVNSKPDDIVACVEQALNETLNATAEKAIAVHLDLAPPGEPLWFEREQLEQVLINLLDNASKFTPKAGTIRIKGYPCVWDAVDSKVGNTPPPARERHSNAYRLDIEDNGPGIPIAALERVFEEYTSYSGSQDRTGCGLGLAICRHIIHQHGGAIWASNIVPTGTQFSFVLPLRVLNEAQHIPNALISHGREFAAGAGSS